jgi:hypothetical protein
MQFWYHTQLIGKMGPLEYILVTPSHHRVHHAINSEYLDRNYGQIFILWDKLFGTFQAELDEVKPVYGVLRPARTWNPVIINYKHLLQLTKDAWRCKSVLDKLRIWFMPTGWRPKDVAERFPLDCIEDPYNFEKYRTENPLSLHVWSWIQYIITLLMMLHMFTVVGESSFAMGSFYALFLIVQIFSLTSLLDGKVYSLWADFFKIAVAGFIIYSQSYLWYGIGGVAPYVLLIYLVFSLTLTYIFLSKGNARLL